MASNAHGPDEWKVGSFDDVQREIRKWRKEGETLESVKAVFEVCKRHEKVPTVALILELDHRLSFQCFFIVSVHV